MLVAVLNMQRQAERAFADDIEKREAAAGGLISPKRPNTKENASLAKVKHE